MALPCLNKFRSTVFINNRKKYANAKDKGGEVGLRPQRPRVHDGEPLRW